MKWRIAALAGAAITIAGWISTPILSESAAFLPDPKIAQTPAWQAPASGPVPVSLTADGRFTAAEMRTAFLRECAEATLKGGFASFTLIRYRMTETRPHHYEAHGEMVESPPRADDPRDNIFDARKVLATPKR
jgi:hypothetical protein